MKSFKLLSLLLFVFGIEKQASGQEQPYIWPTDAQVKAKLETWQNWKFGVLIHWGPYSQWGVVESWSLCPEDEDWCKRRGPFANNYYEYKQAYENISKESFNPTAFNPEKWVAAFKDAGMQYGVFTTKHHDGFCMFDTKYTDYKITDGAALFSTNAKSNVAKEVFNAFRSNGMGVGAYFSKPDWHNNNYWWPYFPPKDRNVNYDPVKYPGRWKAFQQFTYNQIEELVSDYGKLDLLWLDGGWVRPANSLNTETRAWLGVSQYVQDVDLPRIAAMARKHQPGLLVVDRSVHNELENYRTPEQQVPEKLLEYPWESCITLGPNWYSTSPDENYKTVKQTIQLLVNIVAKGGNLLLGIGPDKTGDLVPAVYQRLKGIGEWMKVNGEGIYGTEPNTIYQQGQWRFTRSKTTDNIYAFYLPGDKENELRQTVTIPAITVQKGVVVYLLGYSKPLNYKQTADGIAIALPAALTKQFNTAPALTFKLQQ